MAKTTTKGKEVAVKENDGALTPVNSDIPEHLRGLGTGSGLELTTAGDVQLPRIELLQAGSPIVTESKGEAGQWWHRILDENIGQPVKKIIGKNEMVTGFAVTIVPLMVSSDYVLWNPRDNGGGILDRAPMVDVNKGVYQWNKGDQTYKGTLKSDPKLEFEWVTGKYVGRNIGLGKWGTENPGGSTQRPAATITYYLLAMIEGHFDLGPALFIMSRTQVNAMRKMISHLKLRSTPQGGNLDIFMQRFRLESFSETKGGKTWKNVQVSPVGYVDKENYEITKEMHNQFKGYKISDEAVAGAQTEVEAAGADTGADTNEY